MITRQGGADLQVCGWPRYWRRDTDRDTDKDREVNIGGKRKQKGVDKRIHVQ